MSVALKKSLSKERAAFQQGKSACGSLRASQGFLHFFVFVFVQDQSQAMESLTGLFWQMLPFRLCRKHHLFDSCLYQSAARWWSRMDLCRRIKETEE